MLEKYSVRTDLALEEKERFESDHVEIQGVILEEDYDKEKEIRITRVKIETEKGAKAMGKPVGTYITLEAPNMAVPDTDYHREVSEKIAGFVQELLKAQNVKTEELSVLIVGLGNRQVTPDALGPYVTDNLCATRHIVKEYGKYAMGMQHVNLVSTLAPGVMGQTGMETVEVVRGVVKETKPDLVIAVDALAARNSRRSIGVPVIGIGVPTVVDAATIVNDTMENLILALESSEALKSVGEVLRSYNAAEKYELIKELIAPHLNGMFVTPKDVDEMVKQISYTISEGLNLLLSNAEES